MRNAMTRAFAGAALSALLLAGCSSGGGSTTTSDTNLSQLVADAATKSTASTSKLAMTVDVTQPGSSKSIEITGSGAFDYAKHTGTLTETIPSVGGSPGGTVEIREIGQTVYVKVPNAPDPSKPWVKTDAKTFGAQNGGTQASDPSQFLSYLRGASSGITDEGTETVRGAETRKLKANLDLRKAAAKLPADQKQAVEQAIQQLGTSTIPTEVWIDDQGRMRKMHFALDISTAGQASGGSAQTANLSLTLELFDYGTPVNVEAPPASQVSSQSA